MTIAIVGLFQTGKSTLTNCLIDDCIANVGIGLPTTHMLNYYQAGDGLVLCRDREGRCTRKTSLQEFRRDATIPGETTWIMHELPGKACLRGNRVVDTPGLDSCGVDASSDNKLTGDVIWESDCVILLLPNTQLVQSIRQSVLPLIRKANMPTIAVMNCMPRGLSPAAQDPHSRLNCEVARQIEEDLRCEGVSVCRFTAEGTPGVLPCNVAWWWVSRKRALQDQFSDEQTREVFELRRCETANAFAGSGLPSDDVLAERSNLSPLMNLLSDQEKLRRSVDCARSGYQAIVDSGSLRDELMQRLRNPAPSAAAASPQERLRQELARLLMSGRK